MRLLFAICLLPGLMGLAGCGGPEPIEPDAEVGYIDFQAITDRQWEVKLALDPDHLQPQETPELCWAASVKAINLRTLGQSLSQRELHQNHILTTPLHPSARDMAYSNEVIDAMAGGYREKFNQRYIFDLKVHPDGVKKIGNPAYLSEREIVMALSAGEPVLIALGASENSTAGHIGVIYGAQYEYAEKTAQDILNDFFNLFPSLMSTLSSLGGVGDESLDDQEKELAKQDAVFRTTAAFAEISKATSQNYRLVEVYYWDPAPGTHPDGAPRGGNKVISGDEYREISDFAIAQSKSLAYCEDRLRWAEKHKLGPGFYVRDPINPANGPMLALGLEEGQGAEAAGRLISSIFGTRQQSGVEAQEAEQPESQVSVDD